MMSEQVQTTSGEAEPLLVRHEAPLGWLVLNRPQVRNALNLRTWQLIVKGVSELNDDPDVRVITAYAPTPSKRVSTAKRRATRPTRSSTVPSRLSR